MSAYLDASALVPIVVEEPASQAVDAFLDSCTEALLVSEFAAAEVASTVFRLVRTRVYDLDRAMAALADFDAWRAATTTLAEISAADTRLAHVYVRRFELMLRAPDALHLAVSRRLGATLVTLDRRLETAAHNLGIAVIMPRS